MHRWLRLVWLGIAALVVCWGVVPAFAQHPTVTVQLIAINDFHGRLEPEDLTLALPDGGRLPAGGAAYLATHVQRWRQHHRYSLFVSAGDNIGATPLLSALFHDEPTIVALDAMGLDASAVGNHEFDRGVAELLRLQKGGCHPSQGCRPDETFPGARFSYLAANVLEEATNRPLLPPYRIYTFAGVKVALVGVVLKSTPQLVGPSRVAGLRFLDEAETLNALVPVLRQQGVRAIVALVHEGGFTTGGYNACENLTGPIVDIVRRTNREVDVFITGHTHRAYNCLVDGRVVTSADAYGRMLTVMELQLDRRTGDVRSVQAQNYIVTQDVPAAPALTRLINKYKAFAEPIANRVIGQITADILRRPSPSGEMPLGNLIADAQLAATQALDQGGAVIALVNPGGIRADLRYGERGQVTYGQAFNVQPFGNHLVTLTLTGAQIKTLLEQQFDNPSPGRHRILQVSQGFRYRWRPEAPPGQRVVDITLHGQPLEPTRTYRVTVNSFLADGGDGFSVLQEGTDRVVGIQDLAALEAYFRTHSPVRPPALGRISN